ncbi:MAG TPA: thioredoxin [Bryobacteraceae bacterium]|jgi:thioredoxin 2|nr:thioredoxin [Bryobacteraceae bacterium]
MPFSVVRKCPSCGTGNRIPARHLASAGKCGSCKSPLAPQSEPLDVDDTSFAEVIAEARVPILTDFWAAWCGPCRMAAPEVHELAKEMAGRALVLKVNTEDNPHTSARFNVQSIPNFVVIRDGHAVFQQAGLAPRAEMRRWLETARAQA